MAQNVFSGLSGSIGLLNANFTELYGLYNLLAPVSGVLTATADLALSKATPVFNLSQAAAGQSIAINFRTGTSPRWTVGVTTAAESGGNVGSNWVVARWSDAGALLGYPIAIARATGEVLIEGVLAPTTDNTYTLGKSGGRWSTVYAATGTINTSDAREKTAVTPLGPAEISAARLLASEIGAFKFLDAIAAKGEPAARLHVGMTVQRAIEIMAGQGLDPLAYGFICHDAWPAEQVEAITEARPSDVLDDNGAPIMVPVVVRPAYTRPAGDRYAFRTDELLLFLARGFEARLAALEAAAA